MRWSGCLPLIAVVSSIACSGSPPSQKPDDDAGPGFDCGDALIECTPEVGAECEGIETDVEVPEPVLCSDEVSLDDDLPEGGFPVGQTTVTFTATLEGSTESCTTEVTVTDEVAPEIECEEALTVIRTEPDTLVTPPDPGTASDLCDAEVEITTEPLEVGYGVTNVEYTATDDAGNSAGCTTEITVLDGFTVAGLRVLSASLSGTTTSVTLGWEPGGGDDATGYRIERAPEPDGPFEELTTVGLGVVLYTDGALPYEHAYYRVVTMVGDLAGGATEPLHTYAISATDYDLRDVPVPGISFDTTLYGVVRAPTDLTAGPYPLILLMHGNHGICRWTITSTNDFCETSDDHDCHSWGMVTTPNAEGMLFQVETLAAQGYVAATVSANAMNCRDDYIPERTQLLLEHMRQWKEWSDTGGDPFGTLWSGAVDMERVGLVGHSRGGDAVSNVPLALDDTPIEGVSVESIFAIAPTDYHDTTPVDTAYAVLLPSCDGDVETLMGKDIYDRGLDPDDPVVRAQVFYVGANHNYFNTEWYQNDGLWACNGSDIIDHQAHQGGLEAIEGAWFNGTLGAGSLDPFLRAEGATPAAIDEWAGTALDLRWSYSAPERLLIDEFAGPGAPDTNLLGGANSYLDMTDYFDCYQGGCDSAFEHEKDALYLSWDYETVATATFGLDGEDASAWEYLSFRIVSRVSTWNTGRIQQNPWLRIADGDGDTASVLLEDVQPVWHLYPADNIREILQTVRIPLADLVAQNADLDLDDLDAFELDFSYDGDRGSVLVTDIELAE